jgi:hypothetical protein
MQGSLNGQAKQIQEKLADLNRPNGIQGQSRQAQFEGVGSKGNGRV